MAHAPSAEFNAAATFLSSSSPKSTQPSTQTKLDLYALFKYVSASALPTTPRPGMFDFAGRAKWDAWRKAGEELGGWDDGEGRREAERRYVGIARDLGWDESKAPDLSVGQEGEGDGEDEIDYDNLDSESGAPNTAGGSSAGFGVRVSTMARPPSPPPAPSPHPSSPAADVDEFGYTPLHRAADRGDVRAVEELLRSGAKRDVLDQDGMTARDVADELGHAEIVRLLDEGLA